MGNNVCCFIGHRKINETKEVRNQLLEIIENLITDEKIDTFLFGSKSRFNELCYETVTRLKEKYPYIKRIFVRAEYPYIGDDYKEYILESYEDTYYPKNIIGTGRLSYVKRNIEMINKSGFCVFYFDKGMLPTDRRSGTEVAFNYAVRQAIVEPVTPDI